jgi:hypothetical protein
MLATATRWVLNAVPTWLLVIIIVVVGAVALALLGNWLVRRWLPCDRPWEHNDVAGALLAVVTGLYGLVLAFVIVSPPLLAYLISDPVVLTAERVTRRCPGGGRQRRRSWGRRPPRTP